jgi:hypothetical protein
MIVQRASAGDQNSDEEEVQKKMERRSLVSTVSNSRRGTPRKAPDKQFLRRNANKGFTQLPQFFGFGIVLGLLADIRSAELLTIGGVAILGRAWITIPEFCSGVDIGCHIL